MKKQFELIKNTVIILFGKVCTQFISFLLLPIYTSKLTTGEYGTVDILTTYIFLLVPIITLQLEQSAFRFLVDVRKNEKDKTKIISNIFMITVIQIIVFILLYQIVSIFVNIDYKYYLEINIISTILSSIALQIARGFGRNKLYAIGSALSAIVNMVLNIILIVGFNFKVEGMLISLFIGNMVCAIYICIKLKLYNYIRKSDFSKKESKKMLKYSVPLVPNSVSWWIVNVSDRTIIVMFLDMAANGVYAIANKFTTIFSGIYTIFNLSWSESASLHIDEEDREQFFSSVINNVVRVFSCLCGCVLAGIPFVFDILVQGNYREAYLYIPILLMGALFNIVVGLYGSIYIAKKDTKPLANTTILAAVINIVLNCCLIKYIGLYAAAISTTMSYFVLMIYRHITVKKHVNIHLDYKNIFFTMIAIIIVMILYYYNHFYLNIISLVFIISYSIISNKNTIITLKKEIVTKIKNRVSSQEKNIE